MQRVMIFFICLALVTPISSAITTTFASTYQPGETAIAEISGSILQPIAPSQIVFKRAHVTIAVNYDVKRIGEKYYIYAQMPTTPNNYTVFINNIATTVNGVVTNVNYNKTFIVNGTIIDYSINPGFAIVRDELMLAATLNLDQPTTINLNFPQEQAITLQPGINLIRLSTQNTPAGTYSAAIGRYTLPIEVLAKSQIPTNKTLNIRAIPSLISRKILQNRTNTYSIKITNKDSMPTESITFIYNQEIMSVVPSFISALAVNQSQQLNISLIRNAGAPIREIINATSGQNTIELIILNITFTNNQNETTIIPNATDNQPQYYCSELSGRFCGAEEVCSAQTIPSLDGVCCPGLCEAESSDSGLGWIGYSAIAVAIIIIVIVLMKYKKTAIPKPKTSLLAPPPRLPINSAIK